MTRIGGWLALAVLLAAVALPTETIAQSGPAEAQGKRAGKAQKSAKRPRGKSPSAAAEKQTTADAGVIEKRIEQAEKSLGQGKADAAISQSSAILATGGLAPSAVARTLVLRGQAYRRSGKPAQALADLQSALWLKNGLDSAQRDAAQAAYQEAYREAGLGQPATIPGAVTKTGEPHVAPVAKTETPAAPTERTTAVSSWQTTAKSRGPVAIVADSTPKQTADVASAKEPKSAPPPPPATGGSFLSALFGGFNSTPEPATVTGATGGEARAVAARSVRSEKEPSPQAAEGPDKVSRPAKGAPTKVAAAPAAVAPAPVAASVSGHRIQLAASRSKDDAMKLAERMRQQHGKLLGQREFAVVETVYGNMGTFHIVRFAGFKSAAETKSTCAALRAKGTDCFALLP